MRRIAHISDLHFGRIDPVVVEALLQDLAAEQPDLVAVSGDLTQRARRSEFQAARAFLDRLPARYLVIPGNHDISVHNIYSRFFTPLGRYRRYITEDLSPCYRDEEIAVLGINTARRAHWHLEWEEGRISHEQIAHAAQFFKPLPTHVFKVVVTHHPFLPPADEPELRLVGRARAALRAFESCGVDLLLAGHLHRGYHGDVTTHHTEIRRSILVAQAATATSTRLRAEPNAWNLVEVDGHCLVLRARAFDGRVFQAESESRFRKTGDRWHRESEAAA